MKLKSINDAKIQKNNPIQIIMRKFKKHFKFSVHNQ